MSLAALYTTEFVMLRDTDTVRTAMTQMLQHRVTDLPVVDGRGKLLGMFALDSVLASILPKAALLGHGLPDLNFVNPTLEALRAHMHNVEHESVCNYITQEQTVGVDSSPLEVVLLLYRGARSVPVVSGTKLVGMITTRDLLSALHGT